MLVLASLAVCNTAVVPFSAFHPLATSPHHFRTLPLATSSFPIGFHHGLHASQHHAQDELGQASFGYSHPGQASSTFRDAWGNQVGSYAYIDANGKEVRVSFVADANGFRVVSNNLPEAPVAHPVDVLVGPAPVQETPEVVAAKQAHFAAIAEAKERNAAAVAGNSHRHRRDLSFLRSPLAFSSFNQFVPTTVGHAIPIELAHPSIDLHHHSIAHSVVPHSFPLLTPASHHIVPTVVAPLAQVVPAVRVNPVVATSPTITKFHSQDELGQASFGHSTPDQSHSAVRDVFGNQVGSYSYLTPEGKEVRVDYTAGHGGFRVVSNALPEAPSADVDFSPLAVIQEDPEVIAARKAHFKLFEEARNRIKPAVH